MNLNNLSENRPEFLLAALKARRDECGGGILLGDNTRGRAVMLRPMMISLVFGLYNIHVYLIIYILTCDGPSGTQLLCKSWSVSN
jgi:hypothetical protein